MWLLANDHTFSSVTVEENEQVVAYALSRRPNVRLVETGLTFGKDGFTSYMGKSFPAALKLTRRFYPHHQNVDGFFVAKLKKFEPTPANAVLANGFGSTKAAARDLDATADGGDDGAAAAVFNKAPVVDEEAEDAGDDFGGFDEEEDEKYIAKGRRNAMRRRGLDPHALDGKANGEGNKVKNSDKWQKSKKAA
jgi:25S rRNA (cytosine2870-C5)-methyltransferase